MVGQTERAWQPFTSFVVCAFITFNYLVKGLFVESTPVDSSISHSGSSCVRFKSVGTNKYIQIVCNEVEDSVLQVRAGEEILGLEADVKFTMHEFNYATQSSAPGQVVALEAVRTPDVFIYVELTATESLLSLVTCSDISTVSYTDPKLFRIYAEEGDGNRWRIKNIATGLYLKSNETNVWLAENHAELFPTSMIYEKQNC